MRDPDLVQRAERAATALEQAWLHWRVRHGLEQVPMQPVSSYVGYSLGEPWGQPRVVFGLGADEAERLATMLEGHECVGPVYAEVTSRPQQWHGDALTSGPDRGDQGTVAGLPQGAEIADVRAELPDDDAERQRGLAAKSGGTPPMATAFPAPASLPSVPAQRRAPADASGRTKAAGSQRKRADHPAPVAEEAAAEEAVLAAEEAAAELAATATEEGAADQTASAAEVASDELAAAAGAPAEQAAPPAAGEPADATAGEQDAAALASDEVAESPDGGASDDEADGPPEIVAFRPQVEPETGQGAEPDAHWSDGEFDEPEPVDERGWQQKQPSPRSRVRSHPAPKVNRARRAPAAKKSQAAKDSAV